VPTLIFNYMSCFDSLVGVGESCQDSTVSSSITLEDIGIHVSELNEFVGSDYKTGLNLGLKKIESAIRIVTNELHNKFSEKYITTSVAEGGRIGYEDYKKLVSNEGLMGGLEIEICNTKSSLDFYTCDLSFWSNHNGIVPFYFVNVITGKIEQIVEVEAIADSQVTVNVDNIMKSNMDKLHFVILYDTSLVTHSYSMSTKEGGCKYCEGGGMTSVGKYIRARAVETNNYKIVDSKFVDALGVEITDCRFFVNDIKSSDHTHGIKINYSLQCNHDDWICRFKNKIVLPIAYKAGIEVLKYALFVSKRGNSTVTLDMEKLQARLNEYNILFDQHMETLLNTVKVPNDTACYRCDRVIRYRTARP